MLNSNIDAYNFCASLVAGGEYYRLIDKNSTDCLKGAVESLQGASQTTLNRVEELIQSELEKPDYPDNLVSDSEIRERVDRAEKSAQDPIRGFLGRIRGETELNNRKFRHEISEQKISLLNQLKNYFVKRVLNDLRGRIKDLIEEGHSERRTIETKFTDAIKSFAVDKIDLNAIKVVKRLSDEVYDSFDTPEKFKELIRILRLSKEGRLFHWHIANELRQSFNRIVAGLTPDFGPRTVKKSGPYQGFTPSFMGNYRLRLERSGGETRLFRFLLAKQQPENASDLMSGSQSKLDQEFPISHLSVLYQMEVGFTVDDLRVVGRLKEEYDSYMNGSDSIHIDRDPSRFNPDTIRATIAANNRMQQIQKDGRVLRELLPRIREIDGENRFQYVSLNGNRNGNPLSGVGELEVRVPNRLGYEKTFRVGVDDEELAADEERCDAFISNVRCDFASLMDETPSLQMVMNDFNRQIESHTSRRESEGFYEDYISLVREHHESHQD